MTAPSASTAARRLRLLSPLIPRSDAFWGALVTLLSAAVAVSSLLTTPGLPNTADGPLHLFRALELRWAWEQGVIYPRWATHFAYGLGYPIFNYVPPLTGYLVAGAGLTGLAMQDALKLTVACAVAAGGLGTYLFARRFLSAPAAAVAGAAYSLAPYRLFELYIQGNYPQLLATAIAPFCLLGLARVSSRVDRPGFLILALSTAALALTHNISVVMLAPLLAFYGLWRLRSPRNPHLVPLLLAVAGGVLMAAFFWLPALGERDYVQTWRLTQDFFDFHQHFLSLEDILAFPKVLDFRASNPYFPFSLGGHLVLLAVPSLAYLGRVRSKRGDASQRGGASPTGTAVACQPGCPPRGHVFFMWAALLGYIWLMLPASEAIWSKVPLLAYAEFPHRLLGVASLPLALLVGASVDAWGETTPLGHRGCFLIAMVVVLLGAAPYAFPRKPFIDWSRVQARDVVEFEVETGATGTTSAAEYTPSWAIERPTPQTAALALQAADLIEAGANWARLKVTVEEPGPVVLPFLYFPGWQAMVDGVPMSIIPGQPQGLIEISIPTAGVHEVELTLSQTPLQRRSWWVSLFGLAMIGLGMVLSRGRASLPPQAVAPATAASTPWLQVTVVALGVLLVGKAVYVEPHTMLFRQLSPPGAVLKAQHPLDVTFGGKIALLGYDLERNLPPQGEPLDLTLYWQPLGRLGDDYHVFVHLVSLADGEIVARSEKAAPGGMPSSSWHPALYVEDRHQLHLPEDLPAVRYALRVGLYDPRAEVALPGPRGEMSALLQDVQVVYDRPLDIKRFSGNAWYSFDEEVRLLGFDLDRTQLRPGESATLTLYWRAEDPVSVRMKRFVHLVNGAGTIIAQWDEWPVEGKYPTDLWLPQHNIADQVTVVIPDSAAPGDYTLAVGLYEADSLDRPEVRLRGSERVANDAVVLSPVIQVAG